MSLFYVSECFLGSLGEIRTPDPLFRRQVLYPAELRAKKTLRSCSRYGLVYLIFCCKESMRYSTVGLSMRIPLTLTFIFKRYSSPPPYQPQNEGSHDT
jgi:hypothetical protein